MKWGLMLFAAALLVLGTSCVTTQRGYDYQAHYKKNKKARKKAPQDLTQFKCSRY